MRKFMEAPIPAVAESTDLVTERVDRATPTDTVHSLTRPHSNLMKGYFIGSLLLGPFFLFALIPLYFRYHTLRYRFDDEGVSMRWGILFRREVSLTYSRLQDIHLQSNFVERWLGLARVQLQTASGSSGAEMTIEGLQEYELVRDYLYSRMRGARGERRVGEVSGGHAEIAASNTMPATTGDLGAVVQALEAVALELRGMREELDSAGSSTSSPSSASSRSSPSSPEAAWGEQQRADR